MLLPYLLFTAFLFSTFSFAIFKPQSVSQKKVLCLLVQVQFFTHVCFKCSCRPFSNSLYIQLFSLLSFINFICFPACNINPSLFIVPRRRSHSIFIFFIIFQSSYFSQSISFTIFLFLTIYLFFTSSYFSQSSNFSVAKFQLHFFPVFRSPLSIIFPAFPCTIFSVMFYCLTHNLIVNLFSNIKTLPFHTFKLLAVGSFVIQ